MGPLDGPREASVHVAPVRATMDPMDSQDERPDGGTPRGPGRRWEWWHRQTTMTRRVVRTSLTLLLTGLLAGAVGVSTAATHSSLGPHEAQYEVTLDREITVGLGPIGALIIDSPLPWPLGVEVQVAEIPSNLEIAGNATSGLLSDLQAYGQLFGQPEAAVADAVRSLVTDALGRTAVLWSVMLVTIAAGRLASRGRLRDEVRAALARPGVMPLAGAVALAVVAAVVVPAATPYRAAGYSPEVLAGTPLESARITGRLADLVDAYGPVVKDAYLDNEEFYDAATDRLVAAYEADPGPQARLRGSASALPMLGQDPSRELRPPEIAAGDVADPVTLLLVSDMHCNVGMARVVAAVLEQSGAEVLLDAGDTVMSGTSVESYCVNVLAGAVPDDVPVVVSTGNHDSVTTAQQERDAGFTVLAGETVEVAGISILGDTDPTLTAVGSGTRPEREESIPEMGARLAEAACARAEDGDPVDILLIHNPRAGGPTLDAGCARLQLSGHWHRTEGPEVHGRGVRYVSTSSGGGAGGGTTVGPLTGDAELTVLRLDRETGEPLDYRRIQVRTDATVALGPWLAFPAVPEGAAAEVEPGAPAGEETDGPAGEDGGETSGATTGGASDEAATG